MVVPKRSVRPAPATWDDRVTLRQLGHQAYFEQFGFTVLEGLLSAAQVGEARAEVDRIVARPDEIPNVRVIGTRDPLLPSYDLEDAETGADGRLAIRKLTGLRAMSPALAGYLIEFPALIDVLHLLMGDRVELYRDALMFKSARVGQEKPWHQDAVYWPFRPMTLVSAMVALDRADAGNGCLQVIPGSHKNVYAHQKVAAELQLEIGSLAKKATYVELAPGDCLIFHSLLLHASEHNESSRDRRCSIASYSPGNVTSLDPDLVPPRLISDRKQPEPS